MTVALSDVVQLSRLLTPLILDSSDSISDWSRVAMVLHDWHWTRKPLASMVNILSVALYDLFGADGRFFYRMYTHSFQIVHPK